MSDLGSAQQNLENILSNRYEITQGERVAIREQLESIDIKVKSLISRIGPKPKETLEGIANACRELEKEHATMTVAREDERMFMREIEKFKQKRKLVQDYHKTSDELDALKEKRAELYQELKVKDKTLEELNYGIRKVRIASKLRCSTADVIEQKFNIPEDSMARVVGKGGQNLRQIETDFCVSVDTERMGNEIRIMGTEDAIKNAYGSIMNTVNTSSVEISPSDETIVCLLLNKASYVQDIQARHSVRIDVSRAKKICKITGLANSIASAVVEINLIDSCRVELQIETSMLPSIVGKGGSIIRTLEEEQRVQLDILREENKIVILGFRTDVENTGNTLRGIITENREIEENIQANRHVIISCIIGSGGQTARAMQKELNVGIRVEKAQDDSDLDTIVIRGNTSKVMAAKSHIMGILREFYSQTCRVEVPQDCLPLIVGKKGARINSLRDERPNVSIDIEGTTVYVQSTSEESRLAVKSLIEHLVSTNFTHTLSLSPDIAIAFKGQRGSDLRSLFSSTLELGFEIDSENKSIKLRGVKEKVQLGVESLQKFIADNYTYEYNCDSEDCAALSTPLSDNGISAQKSIEAEYDVEVYINRKDAVLKIRGTEANTTRAAVAIKAILDGDSKNSTLLSVNKAVFSALIGKGGATLKKLESDNDVKLDLLKSKGLVRIRGDPEKVKTAQDNIVTFLDDVRTTTTVNCLESSVLPSNLLARLNQLFDVDAVREDDTIVIRGLLRLVDLAEKYAESFVLQQCEIYITIAIDLIPNSAPSNLFRDIESKYSTTITSTKTSDSCLIAIGGTRDDAMASREAIQSFLKSTYPLQFVSLHMSLPCLQKVASRHPNKVCTFGGVLDIDLAAETVYVSGTVEQVSIIRRTLAERQAEWDAKHPVISIEESLLPSFVGKSGSSIVLLEKESQVKIRVNRQGPNGAQLEVEGVDIKVVRDAVTTIEARLDELRARQWECVMQPDLLGSFIGKEGANIKKFRQETSVNVDIDNKSGKMRVSGDPEAVQEARERILAFIDADQRNNFTLDLLVPVAAYPFVIGPKGATAREIQEATGARLDLDRNRSIVTLRGSEESCDKARRRIEDSLERLGITLEQPKSEVPVPEPETLVEEASAKGSKGPKVCPGAPPSLMQKQNELMLSKSALRRLKRKQQQGNPLEPQTTDEEDDDELTTPILPSTAPTPTPTNENSSKVEASSDLPSKNATNKANDASNGASNGHHVTNAVSIGPGQLNESSLTYSNGSNCSTAPSGISSTSATSNINGKYYKSTSGFSVRL